MSPVTFVLAGDAEALARADELDPDRDWRVFIDGERAWILQTFLRLRAAGHPVALSDRLPQQGIAVFSSKQRRVLRSRQPRGANNILVGVREDVGEALIADFEIVQNKHQAGEQRRFFIPFWPQPGLKPRDATRGTRIENLSFKGFSANLHEDFRSAAWHDFLRSQGMRWLDDTVPYIKHELHTDALEWNDYSVVDLVLAVRPSDRMPYPRKPATKLYNSWHAGVPPLLGPEIAYQELRRSPLDYIEVQDRESAQAAILKLRAQPQLYAAMVENGRQRASEFTPACITQRWAELLFVTLPMHANAPHVRRWRGRSLHLKELIRRALRLIER